MPDIVYPNLPIYFHFWNDATCSWIYIPKFQPYEVKMPDPGLFSIGYQRVYFKCPICRITSREWLVEEHRVTAVTTIHVLGWIVTLHGCGHTFRGWERYSPYLSCQEVYTGYAGADVYVPQTLADGSEVYASDLVGGVRTRTRSEQNPHARVSRSRSWHHRLRR